MEELRIELASGAQNRYIKDLMQHYSSGMRSEKATKAAAPKAVTTDTAFDALRGML